MIPKEIYDYDYEQLVDWLRHEAGSSNPKYFYADKQGGLKLQQVPEEYAKLLLLLKKFDAKTYLALGIGNGGSFALECFFMQENLVNAVAVDNLAYGALINQNEEEIKSFFEPMQFIRYKNISHNRSIIEYQKIKFVKQTTDEFFAYRKDYIEQNKFDVVFVDADHSFEGAKKDYVNALKHISDGGLIIFHDINSDACQGIKKLWQQVKFKHRFHWEYIHSTTCGIGVIQIR